MSYRWGLGISLAVFGLSACATSGSGSVSTERERMALAEKVSLCETNQQTELQRVNGTDLTCEQATRQLELLNAVQPPPPDGP